MSNFLDNKTDAEIEEIYNGATMEDLQSMLTQEKCLNRRRLLRKVLRSKSSNSSDISNNLDTKENTNETNQTKTIPNRVQESEIHLASKKDGDSTLKQLNEKRKQLHDAADLAQRKELRKEIQILENQCNKQPNTINQNARTLLNTESNQTLNSCKEKPEAEDMHSSSKNFHTDTKDQVTSDNKPKFNFIKTPEKDPHPIKKNENEFRNVSNKPSDDKNNKMSAACLENSTKVKNNQTDCVDTKNLTEDFPKNQKPISERSKISIIDKLAGKDQKPTDKRNSISTPDGNTSKYPPPPKETSINNSFHNSQKFEPQSRSVNPSTDSIIKQIPLKDEMSASKPIPQMSTPEIPAKQNISRVSSVREKFENPPAPSFTNKAKTSTKFSEKELNDILNAVLKPEEVMPNLNRGASNEKNLTVPEGRSRKISQQNIIMMIPQMKKKAQIARSSVQVKKEQLLIFCQLNTQEYQNVKITNYSKSWADGLAFCALIHHFYPESFDYSVLSSNDPLKNFTLAFETAKNYAGIEPLIEPGDVNILGSPDEKCVYTYIQFMYNSLKSHPRNSAKRAENS